MTEHTTNEIPYGYCQCGCGQKTTIAPYNHRAKGWVSGEPMHFVRGHRAFKPRESIDESNLPPDARAIPLTKGMVAIVNASDYEWLSQWPWSAWKPKKSKTFYAVRNEWGRNGEHSMIYMHRAIIRALPGVKVDHRDGDGLNNVRGNLRPATQRQNLYNRGKTRLNTSGFKGVTWYKKRRKWVAYITVSGKRKNLGQFDVLIDAARAYDAAAVKYHGEFAQPNLKESE